MDEAAERERIIQELRRISRVMDASIGIPGTKFKFGMDSLIGLIPGVGDMGGMIVSLYVMVRARDLGVSKGVMLKMLGNVLVDTGLGAIPVVGDVFDVFFKANMRNVDLVLGEISGEADDVEKRG